MPVSDPTVTPEHRAQVIAGLRALADLLEARPEVPCPQYVMEQHSVLESLDLTTFAVAPRTTYTVHAKLRGD